MKKTIEEINFPIILQLKKTFFNVVNRCFVLLYFQVLVQASFAGTAMGKKKKTLPIYSQHPLYAIVGWTPINYFILGIISIQDF